jgi:hypothetical protein
MDAFAPDPRSRYLGVLEVNRSIFHDLPQHPAQRQTPLHAVTLLSAGVLNHPLDQHSEVAAILVGNAATGLTVEALALKYAANPHATLTECGIKANGHTRDFIWEAGRAPTPETLRVAVYAAVDERAAIAVYNAFDSLVSVKSRKDVMQSTLHVAGITPVSPFVQKASSLASALDVAAGVLFGNLDHRAFVLPVEYDPLNKADGELHTLLPYLTAVARFKDAIVALDNLNVSTQTIPLRQAAFVGAYLSILHRDPERGSEFLELIQQGEGGFTDGLMDAPYAIKNLFPKVIHPKLKQTTPAYRKQQIVNCVLNVFEGWCANPDFVTADFPTRGAIVRKFNAEMAEVAEKLEKAAAARKVAKRERDATARAARKAEQREAAFGMQPAAGA